MWVHRTQEKVSRQSKGIQANWPLWSLRKPGARQTPFPAAMFVRVVSWSGLLKYSILPVAISRVLAAVCGGGRHLWRLQGDFTLRKEQGQWKLESSKASTY